MTHSSSHFPAPDPLREEVEGWIDQLLPDTKELGREELAKIAADFNAKLDDLLGRRRKKFSTTMIPSAEQLFDIGNELPDPRTIIKPKGGHVHLYQKQVLAESERRSLLLKSRLLMILNTRVRQSE